MELILTSLEVASFGASYINVSVISGKPIMRFTELHWLLSAKASKLLRESLPFLCGFLDISELKTLICEPVGGD